MNTRVMTILGKTSKTNSGLNLLVLLVIINDKDFLPKCKALSLLSSFPKYKGNQLVNLSLRQDHLIPSLIKALILI